MSIREKTISGLFLFHLILVSVLSFAMTGYLWISSEWSRFENESDASRSAYIASQKQMLKREVEQAVDFIEYKKAQTQKRLMASVKDHVYEAHAIAANLYTQHKALKDGTEIAGIIRDALRPVRFNKGRSHIFAFSVNGVAELLPENPESEGTDLLSIRGAKDERVVPDMLEHLINLHGEGFYQYTLPKPEVGGSYPKVAFVKLFEPLKWVIGSDEYLDDVEKDIQLEVLDRVTRIRFGKDGYIFAGDWDGISLSGPARGKNMIDVTDDNGVKIVQELIRVSKGGGGFVTYVLPKFQGQKSAPKISYAQGIADWGWYIGAGVYVDEIETVLLQKQTALNQNIRSYLQKIMLMLVVLLVTILTIVHFLSRRIKNNFNSFTTFFSGASEEKKHIDTAGLSLAEFSNLAESANRMIDKRNEAERSLRESREWLQTILESVHSGIVVIDTRTHRIIEANQAALAMFGASKQDVLNKRCRNFICPDEEGRCPITDLGQRIDQAEHILLNRDGAQVPVLKSCNTVVLGNHTYIIESFVDISEKKELEAQLQQAHKMEAIGTLTGGIAHDFNNILQAISGCIEILLFDRSKEHPDWEMLRKIERSARRAGNLTRRLLVFSRKVDSELQPVDMNAEIEHVSQLLKETIPRMIRIELSLADDLPPINADPVQLEQVLMNLAVNARDAMPDGGVLSFATRRLVLDDDMCKLHVDALPGIYVLFSVSDTGQGMDGEIAGHIFEPFFTTKEKGKGTGLGLAMVYGIVKNHVGFIVCDSVSGRGTNFNVYIPALDISEVPVDEHAALTPANPGGTETILLIDDEEMLLDVGRKMLERFGYTTFRASSGETGLEIFRINRETIDLVILDLNMPGMGGHRCLEELIRIDPTVKVIVASGYSFDGEVRDTLDAGAAATIEKPFQMENMLSKVRLVLDADSLP